MKLSIKKTRLKEQTCKYLDYQIFAPRKNRTQPASFAKTKSSLYKNAWHAMG